MTCKAKEYEAVLENNTGKDFDYFQITLNIYDSDKVQIDSLYDQMQNWKKGFSVGKAAVGAVLLGPIGLVGGALGKKKQCYYCGNCGFNHEY